jgi:hypothetical protein
LEAVVVAEVVWILATAVQIAGVVAEVIVVGLAEVV